MDFLHVFWHDDCLKHDNGDGFFDMPQGTLPDDFLEVKERHPEGVDRVKNMRSILKVSPIGCSSTFSLLVLVLYYMLLRSLCAHKQPPRECDLIGGSYLPLLFVHLIFSTFGIEKCRTRVAGADSDRRAELQAISFEPKGLSKHIA